VQLGSGGSLSACRTDKTVWVCQVMQFQYLFPYSNNQKQKEYLLEGIDVTEEGTSVFFVGVGRYNLNFIFGCYN
jgi:hypothetical protein